MKRQTTILKTLSITLLSTLALAVNVNALTTTSSHTYTNYSIDIQKGEDKLVNALDIIK